MARFRNAIHEAQSHNRTLWIFIVVLFVICCYMWYGWRRATSTITVHIPPDLRNGAEMKAGYIPPANVYQFAYYIYQQLNRWPNNGEKDYTKNIFRLQAFLSDSYRHTLMDRAKDKLANGELQNRTRALSLTSDTMYKPDDVKVLAPGVWQVTLDLHITERFNSTGMVIKNIDVRTPIRVVEANVDPENNPWGLILDGGDKKADRIADANQPKLSKYSLEDIGAK